MERSRNWRKKQGARHLEAENRMRTPCKNIQGISRRLVNKITYDCQRSVSKFLNRGMAGCGADDLLCSQPAMSTIYIQPRPVVQVGLQCLRNGNGTANDLGFTPWNILTKL